MTTLNPSLERNRVEIIDASEPNNIDPVIAPKIIIGIVTNENSTDSKIQDSQLQQSEMHLVIQLFLWYRYC